MNTSVIAEARRILNTVFEEECQNPHNTHCDDKIFFTVKHSLRVEQYAMMIQDAYPELTPTEVLTLRVAAILHDIGNAWQRDEHARVGAEAAARLFDQSAVLAQSGIEKGRLVRIIRGHSDKENIGDTDLVSIILKDADMLDMIGAMSILMHAAKHDFDDLHYFQHILHTLQTKELNYCLTESTRLRTKKAKEILEDKIKFIQMFILQLESEIFGETEHLENTITPDHPNRAVPD